MSTPAKRHVHAQPTEKDIYLRNAEMDRDETACLELVRHLLLFFVDPPCAKRRQIHFNKLDFFESRYGYQAVDAVADVLNTVWQNKKSAFSFSNPLCPECSQVFTEHERRICFALSAIRRKKPGTARVEIIMLCEGDNIDGVLFHLTRLASFLPNAEAKEPVPGFKKGLRNHG